MFSLLERTNGQGRFGGYGHTPEISQQIEAPGSIGLLLDRVQQKHCLLSIRIGDIDEIFSSIILEVDSRRRFIVLDEITPAEGQAYLHLDSRIHVDTRVDGIELHFDCQVTGISESDGAPYYKVPFPAQIQHTQKRRYYRALIPLTKSVPIVLQTQEFGTLHGELRDISVGGFSARLLNGATELISNGTSIQRCLITLPSGAKISASIEICHLDDVESARSPRIGARFYNLGRRDERRIEKFVAALDREISKKQIKS